MKELLLRRRRTRVIKHLSIDHHVVILGDNFEWFLTFFAFPIILLSCAQTDIGPFSQFLANKLGMFNTYFLKV